MTQGTTMTKKRGFAALDPETLRALSKRGGEAAHASGGAHEFTTEEAIAAGRKGGLATAAKRKAARDAA